jgi:hypothetical protein
VWCRHSWDRVGRAGPAHGGGKAGAGPCIGRCCGKSIYRNELRE